GRQMGEGSGHRCERSFTVLSSGEWSVYINAATKLRLRDGPNQQMAALETMPTGRIERGSLRMKYVSTRGMAPELGFCDALLGGLAEDGGLYLPEVWPQFGADEIRAMRGLNYGRIAGRVLRPFVAGEIRDAELDAMIDAAYGQFDHRAVCPLVQTGSNEFILELFHGPTLAFKDVAMQLLARLMDHALAQRGE